MHGMMHQHGMSMMKDRPMAGDERISLNLSAKMKQHQLENMRSHLEAIQSIISLMSEGGYDKASDIAHNKLGLTPGVQPFISNRLNPYGITNAVPSGGLMAV